jgi:hypothetical protein
MTVPGAFVQAVMIALTKYTRVVTARELTFMDGIYP